MKNDNIVLDKSFSFAVRIVRLYQHLTHSKNEFILSKQLLKSGTSVGAIIREAVCEQSTNGFVAKIEVALEEMYKTEYWLELLLKTDYISEQEYDSIVHDGREVTKLLASIVKTTKDNS